MQSSKTKLGFGIALAIASTIAVAGCTSQSSKSPEPWMTSIPKSAEPRLVSDEVRRNAQPINSDAGQIRRDYGVQLAGHETPAESQVKYVQPHLHPVSDNGVVLQPANEGDPTSDNANFRFSAQFNDEPLEDVMFAMLFGEGFRIVGRGDLRITGEIRARSIEEAMQQLEDQASVLAVRRGEQYVIYSDGAEREMGEQHVVYMYKCRKAKASDLLGILENRSPEGFPKAGDPNSSSYSSYSIPDQEIDTRDRAMSEIGLKTPLGRAEYQVVHHLNGILLKGQFSDVRRAVDFLSVIDRPVPVVLVELLIVQYVHDDGFAWRYNLFSGQLAKGDAPTIGPGDAFPEPTSGPNRYGPTDWGANLENFAFNAATGQIPASFSAIGSLTGEFRHNLQLLVSEESARVVTNPHVAVINGHKGTILQNDQFNFQNNIVQPVTGTISQESASINAVTSLVVTPTVVGPDEIHMAINATLSSFVANVAGAAGGGLPDKRQNDVATSVVLRDSQTIIIGGLVREEVNEDRDKIPGLSKIPVIGHLFRGKDSSRRFVETVLYITPHLTEPEGYVDEYLDNIFRESERLQERGERIRNENRIDKYRSDKYYRFNEKLDAKQHVRSKHENAKSHISHRPKH